MIIFADAAIDDADDAAATASCHVFDAILMPSITPMLLPFISIFFFHYATLDMPLLRYAICFRLRRRYLLRLPAMLPLDYSRFRRVLISSMIFLRFSPLFAVLFDAARCAILFFASLRRYAIIFTRFRFSMLSRLIFRLLLRRLPLPLFH